MSDLARWAVDFLAAAAVVAGVAIAIQVLGSKKTAKGADGEEVGP